MADPNDGWETDEDDEDDEEEFWDEEFERSINPARYLTSSRDSRESSSRSEPRGPTRGERYASRYGESQASSSSASSSTPLTAAERMRRATEEREQGRAAAIAKREEQERIIEAIAEREERERTRGRAPAPRRADRSLKPHSRMTYEEANEIAIQLEPKAAYINKYITFIHFKSKIDSILTRAKNNPIAVAEMRTLEKRFRVAQIVHKLFRDEEEKLNEIARKLNREKPRNPTEKRRLEDEKYEIKTLAERLHSQSIAVNSELDEVTRSVQKAYENPNIPPKWKEITQVELTLPNIETDCNEEKFSLGGDPLIQGKCVKLSDKMCYNFDDAINLYENADGKKMISPYTRGEFNQEDVDIMETLLAQRAQGLIGGKRTRRNKKMRKTRVR